MILLADRVTTQKHYLLDSQIIDYYLITTTITRKTTKIDIDEHNMLIVLNDCIFTQLGVNVSSQIRFRDLSLPSSFIIGNISHEREFENLQSRKILTKYFTVYGFDSQRFNFKSHVGQQLEIFRFS